MGNLHRWAKRKRVKLPVHVMLRCRHGVVCTHDDPANFARIYAGMRALPKLLLSLRALP